MIKLSPKPAMLAAATALIAVGTGYAADIPPRPAKYDVPFSAPQNSLDHAAYFVEQRLQIGNHPIYDYASPRADNTTSQFGNIIIIEGKESLVVIDTSISQDIAHTVLNDVRSRTDKPVEAVIYTHHHGDHINGASAFVGDNKNVKIIAADNFVTELASENHATGPLMALRAAYMYGKVQTPTERSQYHVGCCGFDITGNNGFTEPNLLLPRDQPTELTLAGETFIFFATGGESASHLAIYMPERDVLFSGDELQGPTFPQLHSLRGTKPRDVIKWINAIDKMRSYKVAHLVPSHGLPLNDANEIERVLTTYRDAMQYAHDQTVRLINMGYTPDDIAENMKALPADLQLEPWTIEYYGNVDVSARNIYGGYIS
ncbi:MAG: alkyl/aryl-sulfatase, partial [Porticoccaceae bacterium]|nr:alkyl/aryl-sulfatase [Porticoccaceae bacterium]